MNIADSLNWRALGFVFKREDQLVDLRLKNLKKETLLKVADGPLMNVAFDQSKKSVHPRIAVGHEEGQVSVHNLDHENKVKASYRIQSHLNCIYDLVWSLDGEHLYTACGDGTVGYHDVHSETSYISSEKVQYFSATGSTSMKSVVIHPTNPDIFATGSSDGNIFVWDTRVLSKPDISIRQAYSKETKRKGLIPYGSGYINSNSIRSMVFQDGNTLISSCSESSHIKIWDMRRTYCNLSDLPKPMYSLDAPPYVSGFSCLALDSSLMLLYARAQDSTIQIYDVGTSKKMPVSEMPAPSVPKLISFHIKIKLSPDGRHLVAGSSNGTLNLWNTKTRQPLIEPSEDPQFEELTGVDWIQNQKQETLISRLPVSTHPQSIFPTSSKTVQTILYAKPQPRPLNLALPTTGWSI
uniref:Protein lethal(2)denticleless n=1 Tax=Cacopsylla melanoneura TaxID=428564 RepID=A0A8D8Q0S3_9HEMI